MSIGAGLAGGVFGILKSQKIIKLAKTSTIAIIATLAVICAVGTAIAIYNKVQQQKNKKSVENTAEKINQTNINLLEAVMQANQNY